MDALVSPRGLQFFRIARGLRHSPEPHSWISQLELELCLCTDPLIKPRLQSLAKQFAERTVHGPGGRLTSAAVPGIAVELDALFAK